MGRLSRGIVVGLVLAVVVYAAAVFLGEAHAVAAALADFDVAFLGWALAASAGNYVLRFLKWELCLRRLEVRALAPGLGIGRSALVYLAGLSMSITPGKIGEVLRSALLRASDGVPFGRTAPVVVADRLTDVLALVALSMFGLGRHADVPMVGGAVVVACAVLVWLLGSERRFGRILNVMARLPLVGPLAARAEAMGEASARVLALPVLAPLFVLSVLGWGLECLGLQAILTGFRTPAPTLSDAAFLWSFTTLVGAVSFLPGGLGATEASLGVLVVTLVPGATKAVAVGATLLARGATLWFGEVVGIFALAVLARDRRLRRAATGDVRAGTERSPR